MKNCDDFTVVSGENVFICVMFSVRVHICVNTCIISVIFLIFYLKFKVGLFYFQETFQSGR